MDFLNDTGSQKDHGIQPLDAVMNTLDLKNHDLVAVSKEQLTHKMVSKGRKGRRLSLNVQLKILNALNTAQDRQVFTLKDLFVYAPN